METEKEMVMPMELAESYLKEDELCDLSFNGLSYLIKIDNLRKQKDEKVETNFYRVFYPTGSIKISINYFKNEIKKSANVISLNNLYLKTKLAESIFITLHEFTEGMLYENVELKGLNRKYVRQRRDTIKYIEKVLQFPFLKKEVQEILNDELLRLKKYDNEIIKNVPLAATLFSKLYEGMQIMPSLQGGVIDILLTPIKIKEGRPAKLLFKALQIVVYKLLHDNADIPIEKAKQKTADIINEYFGKKGIQDFATLNSKDIDNAIHGS